MIPRCAARVRQVLTAVAGAGALALTGAVTADAATPAPPISPVTSGCATAVAAGSTTITTQVGGRTRTVLVHVPTGYRAGAPTPLVVNLHGSGTTASLQEQLSGMDTTADDHDFLVAYPQGLIPQQIGPLSGYDWNTPGDLLYGGAPVPADAPDDATFVSAVPAILSHNYCINPSRVYLTGFSDGGRLTSYLACHASQVYAAVAPVAGLRMPPQCQAGRAVPVLSFHGTADQVDPYQGHSQQYWTYSVPQAAHYWAAQDRCFPTPHNESRTGYTVTSYSPCAQGAEVRLYTITGEGHEWPGGPTLPPSITSVLGPQSDAVDADSIMWTFFNQHPMPHTCRH